MDNVYQLGDPNRMAAGLNQVQDRVTDRNQKLQLQSTRRTISDDIDELSWILEQLVLIYKQKEATAREKRNDMVEYIVEFYIDNGDNYEPGTLLRESDLAQLRRMVRNLMEFYPKNVKWQAGLYEWVCTIDLATKLFLSGNGISGEIGKQNDFRAGSIQYLEYIRLFKWCLFQGATYAYMRA